MTTRKPTKPAPAWSPPGLTDDERDDFHERAGIAEYDGGLTRAEAERMAVEQVRGAAK